MFLKQQIMWYSLSPFLIRSCNQLLNSTAHIFLFASLLWISFGQGQIAAVDKTSTFTTLLNQSAVQEPPPFLMIRNDVDLKNLTRVYLDAHVAGYVSKDVAVNITWPFENASKVWAYVKKTYGSYGLDPHIYVFIYAKVENDAMAKSEAYYTTHLDADYNFKNVVKLRKPSKIVWAIKENQTNELIRFTTIVASIVEYASKNTKGSPGYNNYHHVFYRLSAWNFIFVYDVFSKIGMKQEAYSFLAADPSSPLTRNDPDIEESLNQDDRVNWIKNWFWPIYSKYGVQALSRYITYSSSYFPRKLIYKADSKTLYYQYLRTMNKGEFVNFWSGSVKFDLRYLANLAFTWDSNDEKNFQRARKSFPKFLYRCIEPSCDKLPVLDQLVADVFEDFLNNNPNDSKNDKLRAAITVISEKERSLQEPIRKRVKGTLYRPLNQSEPYLYDGKNELYIFETPLGLCYYITCSAFYMIKWVTNVPLEEDLSYKACQKGTYLNSRRLQDPLYKNKALQGERQKTHSQKYTIQLIIGGISDKFNMGVLKCEGIENSAQSIHIYLTDSKLDSTRHKFPPDNNIAELFWNHNSDKTLVVPCIGASLKMMPDLRIRIKGIGPNNWTEWKTIWNKTNKTVGAELLGCKMTYNPVIGFVCAYEVWPFHEVSNFQENIYFECFLNASSRIEYKVYLTYEVDDKFISSKATGCVLNKKKDQFIFVGNKTEIWNYRLKIISCSTPSACNLFRKCLDYAGDYCYSNQRELQADHMQ